MNFQRFLLLKKSFPFILRKQSYTVRSRGNFLILIIYNVTLRKHAKQTTKFVYNLYKLLQIKVVVPIPFKTKLPPKNKKVRQTIKNKSIISSKQNHSSFFLLKK